MPGIAQNDSPAGGTVTLDQCVQFFGVQDGGKRCRPHQITEHYGQLSPLAVGGSLWFLCTRPFRSLQFRDRIEDPLSWAKRDAKFLQVQVGQNIECLQVDLVLGEEILKLREAIRGQPLAQGLGHRNSFRLMVTGAATRGMTEFTRSDFGSPRWSTAGAKRFRKVAGVASSLHRIMQQASGPLNAKQLLTCFLEFHRRSMAAASFQKARLPTDWKE